MKAARIKGALVGVEAVTPAGLKDVYKDFNLSGEALDRAAADFSRARGPRAGIVYLRLAERPSGDVRCHCALAAISADLTFAQFVTLTPYPGPWISIAGRRPWESRLRPSPACR